MSELIYKKQYPQKTADAVTKNYFRSIKLSKSKSDEVTLDELLESLDNIPLHERQEGAKRFIRRAVRMAGLYEISVEIRATDNLVSAKFGLGVGGNVRWIKRMMRFTDDIHIFADPEYDEVYLIMEYYTHALSYNSKQIMPPSR